MSTNDECLLLREVAAVCRVPLATVRYWIYKGRLPSLRPGRRRLVRRSDLDLFLEAHTKRAKSASVAGDVLRSAEDTK